MKLATSNHGGRTRVGTLDGDAVADLSGAAPELPRSSAAGVGRRGLSRAPQKNSPPISKSSSDVATFAEPLTAAEYVAIMQGRHAS